MDIVDYLREERRRVRDRARHIEEELGPQHALGWNDCAAIDGKKMDKELGELEDLVRRLERLERDFAWPLLRKEKDARLEAAELEDEERRLEDWVRLIRTIVAAGDSFHIHSLRSGLRSLIRELEAYMKRAEQTADEKLRETADAEALEELGRRAERS